MFWGNLFVIFVQIKQASIFYKTTFFKRQLGDTIHDRRSHCLFQAKLTVRSVKIKKKIYLHWNMKTTVIKYSILVLKRLTFLVDTTGVLCSTCGDMLKSSVDMLMTSGTMSVENVSRDSSPS